MREIKFRAWDGKNMFPWGILYDGFYAPPTSEIGNYRTMIHMQFTGLYDKNGREIYEGDIVKTEVDVCEVYWWQPTCQFTNVFGRECVVIGNIHQNPELLKQC